MELTPKQIRRFWKRVTKTEDCWLWDKGRDTKGYGQFNVGSSGNWRIVKAHRVSFYLTHGDVPTSRRVHIDHLCHNPPCVNPDHLEAVTVSTNLLRHFAWVRHQR